MDFFSAKKTGGQAGGEAPPTASELFSSAKLVTDAAQTCFQSGADKVDKGKVAGAAADLLGAASHYGKLEEKGYGEYVQKAETYLEQYSSTGSAPAPAPAPAADKETPPAPEPDKETPPAPDAADKETAPALDADEETPPAPDAADKKTAPAAEPAKETAPEAADSGAGGTAEGIFKMAEGLVKGGGGSFFG